MVSLYNKGQFYQIRSSFIYCHEHSQELLFISGQLLIRNAQSLVKECNWVALLLQNSSYTLIISISLYLKWFIEIR
jgi:hypothetical protein